MQIAFDVLGKLATPALMLYSDINNVMKAIKENKLEDKLNKAWINVKNRKKKTITLNLRKLSFITSNKIH